MRNKCPICFSTKITYNNGDYKCERCQHVFPDKTNLEPPSPPTSGSNAFRPNPAPTGGLMGWICPVCGRGLSPYTDSCPCVVNWEITCGTGTAVPQHGEIISHIHQVYQDNVSANTYSNTTPVFKPPREEKYNV